MDPTYYINPNYQLMVFSFLQPLFQRFAFKLRVFMHPLLSLDDKGALLVSRDDMAFPANFHPMQHTLEQFLLVDA